MHVRRLVHPELLFRWTRILASTGLASYYLMAGTLCTYRAPSNVLPGVDAGHLPRLGAAFGAGLALALLGAYATRIRGDSSRERLCVALMLFTLVLSAPSFVEHPGVPGLRSMMALIPFWSGLCLPWVAGGIPGTAAAVVLAGTAQGASAVLGAASGAMITTADGLTRAAGSLGSPDALCTVVVVCLACGLWLIFSAQGRFSAVWWSLCCTVLWAALILTWSCLGVISGTVVTVVVTLRMGSLERPFLQVVLPLMCACFVVLSHAGLAPVDTQSIPGSRFIVRCRSAVRLEGPHWAAGLGPGRVSVAGRRANGGAALGAPIAARCGEPLVWIDELGVGGLLFLTFICIQITRSAASAEARVRPLLVAAWGAVGIVAVFRGILLSSPVPAGPFLLGALMGALLLGGRPAGGRVPAPMSGLEPAPRCPPVQHFRSHSPRRTE